MYYVVEVPGAMVYLGDTHAAQGDSELAGTAMETSLTAKLRLTLHKADSLPKKVATLDFPLLETATEYVVHGFAYANYLNEFEDPTSIFAEGGSLDLAMEDCFVRTRNWLMDVMDLAEEETIALMTMGIDYGTSSYCLLNLSRVLSYGLNFLTIFCLSLGRRDAGCRRKLVRLPNCC